MVCLMFGESMPVFNLIGRWHDALASSADACEAESTRISVFYCAATYFGEEKPARACYAAKALPLGAAVEIEAIAYVP